MPLEPRNQDLALRFGLDLSEDDEGQPNGALELENFDFDKDGAAVRRFGFIKASSGPTAGSNVPEMLVPTGAGLQLLSSSDQSIDVSTITTLFDGRRVQQVDSAVDPSRSWICVVATVVQENSSTLTYETVYWVVDLATGRARDYGSLGSNTWGAQVAAVYNHSNGSSPGWNIYYASGAAAPFALKVVKLTLSSGVSVLGTPSTVVASMWDSGDSMLPFSVRPTPTPGYTYVAYVTVTTGQLVVVKHDETATQVATLTPAGAAVSAANVANVWLLVLAAGTVCMFYQNSTNLIVKTMDAALAGVTATATLATTLGALSGVAGMTAAELSTNFVVFCVGKTSISGTVYDLYVNTYDFGSATLGSTPVGVQHALPLSRADLFSSTGGGTRVALLTGTQDSSYPNGTVLAFDSSLVPYSLGMTAYDELAAPSPATRSTGLWSWSGTATTKYIAEVVALETVPGGGPGIRRIRVAKATFGPDRAPRSRALIGTRGYVSGGHLRSGDARTWASAAFVTRPNAPGLVGNVGGSLPAGTYNYCTVLEYADAAGTVQVSPPSAIAAVTLASAGTVSVTLSAYTFVPAGSSKVRVKLYRTTLSSPSTFNLVATYVLDANSYFGGTSSVTHTDQTVDTTAALGEILYTTGDALASELVPALSYVCAHRDRLFGIDALDPHIIRFTTEISDATAPRWNAVLTTRVDNNGGAPLALASMNDKLLIIQRDQICVVTGQGPDGTGSGSFSLPEVVAHIGVEPSQIASVVETPVGVFFAHRSGIQLITPDLQVVPVGKALGGKTVGTDLPVSFGRYVPTRSQVWFQTQLVNGAAPIFIYDLRFSRWLKWTGGSSWVQMLDVVDYGGVVYAIPNVVTGGGSYTVMQLSASDYRDENPASLGTFVAFSQVVAPPWFRGDRAQELRLWKITVAGRKFTQNGAGTTMTLQVYTQDERKLKDPTVADNTYTWAGTDTSGLPVNWLVRARVVTQRCRAFRVRLTLTPDSSVQFEPYYTLSTISYDYGVLPSRGKVAPKGRASAA